MRLGALLGPLSQPGDPRELSEQVRRFTSEGFTSLWTAQALGRGFMMTDPLVALSVAATLTDENVRLGTAVMQVPLYHPVDLAHRVLSLQQICGNRLILGVGAGSTKQDFDAFDRNYESRFTDFTTHVRILRRLFGEGRAGDADLTPWDAVKDGPPLYFGSWGNGVERAAREFDGWIASAHYRTVEEIELAMQRYRAVGGSNSIISTIQIHGGTDLGEIRDKLQRFHEMGFDDAVVMILPGGPEPAAIAQLMN